MSQVKIGIIGAGNIGNVHIEQFKQVEDARIVAVTDTYLPVAEKRAQEHGIPAVKASPQELIEDPSIDAVVIGVPNKYHSTLAIEAMRRGKHVVLEKPMAIDAASAKEIARVQKETGLTLMIPHQMRWEPVASQLKKLSDKGEFGRIYNVKAGWMRRKGIPGWGTWFTQMSESGGGALIDIGVHLLDLSLYLMGNPKPVSVSGATFAAFGPHKRGIGTWGTPNWDGTFDVDDLASAFIKLDNGATLSLDVSWAVNSDMEKNGPFIHLFGEAAGATIRGANEGRFFQEVEGQLQERELAPVDGEEGARLQMSRHFIDCVKNGKTPISNVMTGLGNNLVLDAIYESSRTGREVVIDWNL